MATTISPAAGALALTGYPAAITGATIDIAPGVGALAITGYAPSVAFTSTLSPNAPARVFGASTAAGTVWIIANRRTRARA